MLNNVCMQGRVVRELELNVEKGVLKFSIAVNRNFKDKNTGEYGVDFINCVAFGKTAEIIAKFSGKGKLITIVGSIQTGSYEKDGVRMYTTEIVVQNSDIFTGNPKTENENGGYKSPYDINQENISDEDLPF